LEGHLRAEEALEGSTVSLSGRVRIGHNLYRNKKPKHDGHKYGLTWFGHVTRMENGRLPIMALHSHVDGRRDRGRPTKTWMDNIMQDIKAQGMDIREATDKARESSTWRFLVRASWQANA